MKTAIALSVREKIFSPFNRITTKDIIPLIAALLLSTLFIYAAYNKLIIYETFASQLGQSPLLKNFNHILAWLVPGIEILIPVLFLFKPTRTLAFYSSFFLMLAFTAYVFIIPTFFEKEKPCACGGIISGLSWGGHFWFNLAFLLLAIAGLTKYTYRPKPKQ